MTNIILASVLVESVVERLKDAGLAGYSCWLSLIVGVIVSIGANIQIIPIDLIDNPIVNQVASGIIISGGSNYANSFRDKIRK